MLGEHGASIKAAPYLLESYVDKYDDEKDASVRLELLSAVLKLFFLRAPEVRPVLQRLLSLAIADVSNQVADRKTSVLCS